MRAIIAGFLVMLMLFVGFSEVSGYSCYLCMGSKKSGQDCHKKPSKDYRGDCNNRNVFAITPNGTLELRENLFNSSQEIGQFEGVGCIKFIAEMKDDEFVLRGCHWDWDSSRPPEDNTCFPATYGGIPGTYCYCKSQNCNDAGGLYAGSAIFLVSISVISFAIQ